MAVTRTPTWAEAPPARDVATDDATVPTLILGEAYRPFFLFGVLYATVFLVLWGIRLLVLAGEVASALAALNFYEHAHAMIFGIVGSYVFGFSLTAFPRQNAAWPIDRRIVLGLLAFFVTGQLILLAGWLVASAQVAFAGRLIEIISYAGVLSVLLPIGWKHLSKKWSWQPAIVLLGLIAGFAGASLDATGGLSVAIWASRIGIWPFLSLLIAAFAWQVVPYFTSRVVPGYEMGRGRWFLPLTALLLWALVLSDRLAPGWPQAAVALALAAMFAREGLRWAPLQGARVPLVGVLLLGWLWLILGWIAIAVSALGFGRLNAVHVLTVGGIMTFVFAISTRVTLGHGGLPLRLGKAGALAIALVQLSVLIRIVAPFHTGTGVMFGNAIAAFVLAGAFTLWLAGFGRWLIAPKSG